MNNKHLGSDFDDFLIEAGILVDVEAKAIKSVIAFELEKSMNKSNISKTQLAKAMKTSRSSLDRLLDPENTSVTLISMIKAAAVLGKKLQFSLVNSKQTHT